MTRRRFSNTKRLFARVFNVRGMVDYNRLRYYLLYIVELAKTYFVPQSTKKGETFEEATSRLNLNEDELAVKQRALLHLSQLMLGISGGLFVYAMYQLIYGSLLGFIPSCALLSIALALAFRYHFWYVQIQMRQLGLTFAQWRKRNQKDSAQ